MTARVTEAALAKAARVAASEGVCIEITTNGKVYRIAPAGAVSPLEPSDREAEECDKAFGVGR